MHSRRPAGPALEPLRGASASSDLEVRRAELRSACADLIRRCAGGLQLPIERDALLARVLTFQLEHVPVFARYALGAESDDRRVTVTHPDQVPGLSTEAFRVARVASFSETRDVRTFRTSGTTAEVSGSHAFCDLSLYDTAARTAAAFGLFSGCPRMRVINLASSPAEAPTSSLSYMLDRFGEWFGLNADVTWCVSHNRVQVERLIEALDLAILAEEPIALLGTSFAFLFADDELGQKRFELPPGSFVMQTGGFKGRVREVAPLAMRSLMRSRYGVSDAQIVAEYGMTELSSQLYSLRGDTTYWVPGWVRATPVDPQSLLPVPEGQLGILRIDDLANVDSVCSIQTYDVAVRRSDRIELIGRAEGTTPRGCSLRMESVLSDAPPAVAIRSGKER